MPASEVFDEMPQRSRCFDLSFKCRAWGSNRSLGVEEEEEDDDDDDDEENDWCAVDRENRMLELRRSCGEFESFR
ncbi:hypothetical protein CRG98_019541 [Punica granatum]|uniref:Uncharacterized protein n=1 Tax=Punica granatum TaxID=22663 RepID=A0A2I0JX58_PUNGR|nr:hypothetical protein CRG98_019541 [Punica granatum]